MISFIVFIYLLMSASGWYAMARYLTEGGEDFRLSDALLIAIVTLIPIVGTLAANSFWLYSLPNPVVMKGREK